MSGIYQSLEKYSIEEFVEICKSLPKVSTRKQNWLNLIKEGRLTCPISGLKVAYCSLDVRYVGKKGSCSYHYNFYTECGQLITIDHIKPKFWAGGDTIENIQPMISIFNSFKSSKIISNEKLKSQIKESNLKLKHLVI